MRPKSIKVNTNRFKVNIQNRSNILSKLSDPSAKSVAPSDHKLFTRTKKTLKNPQKSSQLKAALWLKPDPFFD